MYKAHFWWIIHDNLTQIIIFTPDNLDATCFPRETKIQEKIHCACPQYIIYDSFRVVLHFSYHPIFTLQRNKVFIFLIPWLNWTKVDYDLWNFRGYFWWQRVVVYHHWKTKPARPHCAAELSWEATAQQDQEENLETCVCLCTGPCPTTTHWPCDLVRVYGSALCSNNAE